MNPAANMGENFPEDKEDSNNESMPHLFDLNNNLSENTDYITTSYDIQNLWIVVMMGI
jgi:hypothetical protein